REVLNEMEFSATAFAIWWYPTSCGAKDWRAGMLSEWDAPLMNEASARCHGAIAPVATSKARTEALARIRTWLSKIIRRRSKRSAKTPAGSVSVTEDSERAVTTTPRNVADPVRSYASQPTATCWIHMPIWLAKLPIQR